MATRIEWCDESWSPIKGCSHCSEACDHCWAKREARIRSCNPKIKPATRDAWDAVRRWDGTVRLVESQMDAPMDWRKPRRVAVCLHTDLFHPNVPGEWRDRVFAVMALCPQHRFIVLTKRAETMREYYLSSPNPRELPTRRDAIHETLVSDHFDYNQGAYRAPNVLWPLPNLTLGITAENQPRLDERLPFLLDTPAAARCLSLEPLLGPVDLSGVFQGWHSGSGHHPGCDGNRCDPRCPIEVQVENPPHGITEVYVGCETGPGARPCEDAWVQSVVEQCREAGVRCVVKALRRGRKVIRQGDADWPAWAGEVA